MAASDGNTGNAGYDGNGGNVGNDPIDGGVRLFGAYHVDRRSKVVAELEAFAEPAEALLVEAPHPTPGRDDYLACAARNPAVLLAGLCLDAVWKGLGFLATRRLMTTDRVAVATVAEARDLPVHPVDENVVRLAADVGPLGTAISWMWTALVAATGLLAALLAIVSPVVGGAWAVLAFGLALLPVVPFAYLSLEDRDGVMARRVRERLEAATDADTSTDARSGTEVCLVVGNRHVPGIREALESAGVTVTAVHRSRFARRAESTVRNEPDSG